MPVGRLKEVGVKANAKRSNRECGYQDMAT